MENLKPINARPLNEREFIHSAKDVFETLTEKVEIFKLALADTDESGDQTRVDLRSGEDGSLLMKPLGQLCLIEAFVRVKKSKQANGGVHLMKYVIELIKLIGVKIIRIGKIFLWMLIKLDLELQQEI